MLNQTSTQTTLSIVALPVAPHHPIVAASPDFTIAFAWGRDFYYDDGDEDGPLPTPHHVLEFLHSELNPEAIARDAVADDHDLSRMSYEERLGFVAGWLASLAEAIAERRAEVPGTPVIIH